tara:strand:- start:2369 stop:2635 length:267 start_codon:yes stop_codon:yes gene_type:complete
MEYGSVARKQLMDNVCKVCIWRSNIEDPQDSSCITIRLSNYSAASCGYLSVKYRDGKGFTIFGSTSGAKSGRDAGQVRMKPRGNHGIW